MLLGKVIGSATATMKHASLHGWKLLVVQPDGAEAGDPQLAVDNCGAGVGDAVFITSDGRYARALLEDENTPLRWTVIGIRDAPSGVEK